MKTQALKQALDIHKFDFAFGGARRDEEKSRAKETAETLLFFCWDTDSYRLLRPESVTSVVPLASILNNQE